MNPMTAIETVEEWLKDPGFLTDSSPQKIEHKLFSKFTFGSPQDRLSYLQMLVNLLFDLNNNLVIKAAKLNLIDISPLGIPTTPPRTTDARPFNLKYEDIAFVSIAYPNARRYYEEACKQYVEQERIVRLAEEAASDMKSMPLSANFTDEHYRMIFDKLKPILADPNQEGLLKQVLEERDLRTTEKIVLKATSKQISYVFHGPLHSREIKLQGKKELIKWIVKHFQFYNSDNQPTDFNDSTLYGYLAKSAKAPLDKL